MSRDDEQVDLTNCDREPIHQLGNIQAFGGLIAVTSDWIIAHRSANCDAILGLKALPETGSPLSAIFTGEAMERLGHAAALLVEPDEVERIFGVHLSGSTKQGFDCSVHQSGSLTVIEFEPHRGGGVDRQMRVLRPIMRQLETCDTIEELCQQAAEKLRALLDIDRVMVYRFHRDNSGEVIAEALNSGIDSFHGLRYPASDIPVQARALFVRNRFRYIADLGAEPVPVEPFETDEGAPIDLSLSMLRSVSTIHVEYLRNMGVFGSLSIAIVVDGKLWGLFACHHYAPLDLPYPLRTAAELFSELFSLTVERSLGREQAAVAQTGRDLHDRLMRAVANGNSLVEALPTLRPIMRRSLPHDGISAWVDGEYRAIGSAPTQEEFAAIIPALNAAAASQVITSECLTERFPAAEAFADRAAGAMFVPVSRSPRDYIVLWRKEMRQTVTWAGNPDKPVEAGPNGDRLTPRKSFEAWTQSVTGCAEEWSDFEVALAERVRVTLLEIILRLTDELATERARAQQQQELLIAELNHRVRNILNLIRSLINQSRHEAIDIESFSEIVGGRISSLASAHDNITRENWSPASVTDLIRTEADAYISGKDHRILLSGDEALITPEAYTVLALVIHEMVTNSAKYGALCDSAGTLSVDISTDESGMTIGWSERGGPPVKPPTRRGFGSTIIEKSIPFELNGSARVDYALSGVNAEFWVPGRFVTVVGKIDGDEDEPSPSESAKPDRSGHGKGLPRRVLVVEDSMIIALDTEECLQDLGVENVQVASSVAGALEAIKQSSFDMALLDYNLGTESSDKVAEALVKCGTPFWLATGYGELAERIQEFGARGVLTKPYGGDDLEALLKAYSEGPPQDA